MIVEDEAAAFRVAMKATLSQIISPKYSGVGAAPAKIVMCCFK
jgi:hypothetical protein